MKTDLQKLAQSQGLKLFGLCETCKKEQGIRKFPYLENKQEAVSMSYISCENCFSAVWAGEN